MIVRHNPICDGLVGLSVLIDVSRRVRCVDTTEIARFRKVSRVFRYLTSVFLCFPRRTKWGRTFVGGRYKSAKFGMAKGKNLEK